MTADEARSVLGVGPGASPRALRDAFLTHVRDHHPDTTDHPLGAGERTATIIAAYRLLRDLPDGPPRPVESAVGEAPEVGLGPIATIEVITDEAIWVGVEAAAVVPALLEVADDLGDVSYVDRSVGLLQLTVRPPEGPTCWFTISVHPRPGGTVLVATLESIEAQPTPPAGPLMLALAEALADLLGR